MKVGNLHRHSTEMNVLMALFGRAWESGLKTITDRRRTSLPVPSSYRDIDFSSLSRTLTQVSRNLQGKAVELEFLVKDVEATPVEKQFGAALLKYCQSFNRTVDVLNRLYAGLNRGVGRSAVDRYDQVDYERDVAAFSESARQHKVAGAAVDELYADLGANDGNRTWGRNRTEIGK